MNNESRVAAALFQRFETLVDSKTALFSSSHAGIAIRDIAILQAPFGEFFEGLKVIDGDAAGAILGHSDAILVGAKDFRSPERLGAVQSRFCYVVVLGSGKEPEPAKYFHGRSQASQDHFQFWEWSAKLWGEAPSTTPLYATQIEQLYFLVSNDLFELRAVAKALDPSNAQVPTLEGVPQWELVSQHAFWAYRRYQRDRTVNRPAAGLTGIPRDSETLILVLDLGRRECAIQLLRAVGSQTIRESLSLRRELPSFEPLASGVWASVVPLSGDEQTLGRLLAVLGIFGFGVYL